MALRVAVDAMGGDHAPAAVVEGALLAARQASGGVHVLLFGPEAALRDELGRHPDATDLPVDVVDAPEVIGMAEPPAAAVKNKRRSSIHLGLGAHYQGAADAFVSAGNTGAVMAAALFILGRLPGVGRPTLLGYIPTTKSHAIGVDIGTNVDCKPEHLVQFAQMGSIYAQRIMQRENPVIGLLNIGEEPGKGNEQVKAAYELMAGLSSINFRGNIEGRDVLHHAADVVVFDGFVGNIILKFGESCLTTVLSHLLRDEMARLAFTPEQQGLVKKLLSRIQQRFDYEEYGGAPLLGVAGTVLIGHGSSTPRAVARMIRHAVEVVEQDVAGSIAAAIDA